MTSAGSISELFYGIEIPFADFLMHLLLNDKTGRKSIVDIVKNDGFKTYNHVNVMDDLIETWDLSTYKYKKSSTVRRKYKDLQCADTCGDINVSSLVTSNFSGFKMIQYYKEGIDSFKESKCVRIGICIPFIINGRFVATPSSVYAATSQVEQSSGIGQLREIESVPFIWTVLST
jgi:hypothetical protein